MTRAFTRTWSQGMHAWTKDSYTLWADGYPITDIYNKTLTWSGVWDAAFGYKLIDIGLGETENYICERKFGTHCEAELGPRNSKPASIKTDSQFSRLASRPINAQFSRYSQPTICRAREI